MIKEDITDEENEPSSQEQEEQKVTNVEAKEGIDNNNPTNTQSQVSNSNFLTNNQSKNLENYNNRQNLDDTEEE